MDVSPGDEVVIIGAQGDDRIDVARDGRGDRHDSVGSRLPLGSRIERVYRNRDWDRYWDQASHYAIEITIARWLSVRRPSSSVRSAARSRQVARQLRRLRRVELAGRGARRRERPERRSRGAAAIATRWPERPARARLYADIEIEQHARLSTGIDEFDRVLGGGVVPGSLVLLGGEPGIGKSTLLLQAAANMARTVGPVLYSSGEESEHQVKSRGERLGVGDAPLYLLAETCLERILEEIARIRPALVIVDSIQTVFSLKFQSAPGSIGQVREAATQLLFTAKGQNVPTFLVGHVTKDGSLAGPKALEHVVDTVLYFEGERHHSHRVVRAVKNRFGAVSELGVFEMTSSGLRPVPNPSKLFLAERPANAPGSAVLCSVEGSRPILVEVQALVSTSTLRKRAPDGERHRSAAARRCCSRCSRSARG